MGGGGELRKPLACLLMLTAWQGKDPCQAIEDLQVGNEGRGKQLFELCTPSEEVKTYLGLQGLHCTTLGGTTRIIAMGVLYLH